MIDEQALSALTWLTDEMTEPSDFSIHSNQLTGRESSDRTANARLLPAAVATLMVFAIYGWQWPPGVNESHYLTKAKHFWDPSWCAGDLFLESHAAHWGFYAVFGWLTLFFSLDATAWIGRLLVWTIAAWSWVNCLASAGIARWLIPLLAMAWLLFLEYGHLAGEWVVGGFEAKSVSYALILNGLAAWNRGRMAVAWRLFGWATFFHLLVGGWVLVAMLLVSWRSRSGASGYLKSVSQCLPSMKNESGRLQTAATRTHGEPANSLPPNSSPNFVRWFWTQLLRRLMQPERRQVLITGGGVLLLVFLAAVPTMLHELRASPDVRQLAAEIQVKQRLSHHLWFDAFDTKRVAAFAVLVAASVLVMQGNGRASELKMWRRLAIASLWFGLIGLVLSALASGDDGVARRATGLLRLYWFRLADFAVPTFFAVGIGASLTSRWNSSGLQRIPLAISLTLIALAFGLRGMEEARDPRPPADRQALPSYPEDVRRTRKTFENWQQVCAWVREHTKPTDLFLTPAEQQTFKWYAERPEVVCWKDMPQDAASLAEWWRRVQQLTLVERAHPAGLASFSDAQLLDLAREFGASYLIMPQRHWEQIANSSSLPCVYPSDAAQRTTYVVIDLRNETGSDSGGDDKSLERTGSN